MAMRASPAFGKLLEQVAAIDDMTLTPEDAPSLLDVIATAREVNQLPQATKAAVAMFDSSIIGMLSAVAALAAVDTHAIDEYLAQLADAKRRAEEPKMLDTSTIETHLVLPPIEFADAPPKTTPPAATPAPATPAAATPAWWSSVPAWWSVVPAPLLQNRVLPTAQLHAKLAAAAPKVAAGDVIQAEHVTALYDAVLAVVDFLDRQVGDGSKQAQAPAMPAAPASVHVLNELATKGLTVNTLAGSALRSALEKYAIK
jgi:hypothetical protein